MGQARRSVDDDRFEEVHGQAPVRPTSTGRVGSPSRPAGPSARSMLDVQRLAGNRAATAMASGGHGRSAGPTPTGGAPAPSGLPPVSVQTIRLGPLNLGSSKPKDPRGPVSVPYVRPRTDFGEKDVDETRKDPTLWAAWRAHAFKGRYDENLRFIEDLDRFKAGPSLLERLFGTGRSAQGLADKYVFADTTDPSNLNVQDEAAAALRQRLDKDGGRSGPDAFDEVLAEVKHNLSDGHKKFKASPEYAQATADRSRRDKTIGTLESAGIWH